MSQPATATAAGGSASPSLRFGVVAGLTAALGPFTALVPMVIYALLGTSRVLSVSSNTALTILCTQLRLAVPEGDADRTGRCDAGRAAAVEVRRVDQVRRAVIHRSAVAQARARRRCGGVWSRLARRCLARSFFTREFQ